MTYDNILRFCDDPDVRDAIQFLRAREVVHYQRFGETKRTKWQQQAVLRTHRVLRTACRSMYLLWLKILFFMLT